MKSSTNVSHPVRFSVTWRRAMTKSLLASIALVALVGCSADTSENTDPVSSSDPTIGDPTKAHHEEAAAFKDALVLPGTEKTDRKSVV